MEPNQDTIEEEDRENAVADENNNMGDKFPGERKIAETRLKTWQPKDYLREPDYVFNPVLYTRGLPADAFYLILSGKVMVCSGDEGFMIMQSSFNVMGVEALTRQDYKPDFSAKVIDKARILRITRL